MVMGIIKTLLQLSRKYNLVRSFMWCMRLFPMKAAIKLPVLVGYGVRFLGDLSRNLHFDIQGPLHMGMVRLGVSENPTKAVSQGGLIRMSSKARLVFKGRATICDGFSIIVPIDGVVEIGDDVFINQSVMIYANNSIRIGDYCRIGWDVQIADSDSHVMYNHREKWIANPAGRIVIGRNVWLASKVTVRKNSVIPDYSIVSGGSMVNKDYSSVVSRGNVFVGVPAKLVATDTYRLLNETLEMFMKRNSVKLGSAKIKVDMTDGLLEEMLTKYPSDKGVAEEVIDKIKVCFPAQ